MFVSITIYSHNSHKLQSRRVAIFMYILAKYVVHLDSIHDSMSLHMHLHVPAVNRFTHLWFGAFSITAYRAVWLGDLEIVSLSTESEERKTLCE